MAHFLDIDILDKECLHNIIANAIKIKKASKEGDNIPYLQGKQLAMIFEKSSTRTRVSFQAAINKLGGQAIIIDSINSQLGRGEPISDTAQVLSRYVDIIMIRCFEHETLLKLAKFSLVPVINGLSDKSHPCQIMADIMTYIEHRGKLENKIVAWVGDGNNVTNSWIHAATKFNFKLNIATPIELMPQKTLLDSAIKSGANIELFREPHLAAQNADLVTTDTWVSMGDTNADSKHKLLEPYRVCKKLMSHAKDNAIFMHCLPAHLGEEVTEEVFYGSQSVIFDEAENRMHVQKAIMIWCLKN